MSGKQEQLLKKKEKSRVKVNIITKHQTFFYISVILWFYVTS